MHIVSLQQPVLWHIWWPLQISLTTIGYGDIAPDSHYAGLTIIYLTLGLSLATMFTQKTTRLFHDGLSFKFGRPQQVEDFQSVNNCIFYKGHSVQLEHLVNAMADQLNVSEYARTELLDNADFLMKDLITKSDDLQPKFSTFSVDSYDRNGPHLRCPSLFEHSSM